MASRQGPSPQLRLELVDLARATSSEAAAVKVAAAAAHHQGGVVAAVDQLDGARGRAAS